MEPTISVLKSLLISEGVRTFTRDGLGLYYDLFQVTSSSEALREAAGILAAKIPRHINVLVAPGLGAAGLAAAIALQLARPMIVLTVRDPKKLREGERLVEGAIPTSECEACFVDDTITFGGTYRTTINALHESAPYVKVKCCAILLDGWHASSRAIHASGVPVYSCLRRHDINLTRDCIWSAAAGPRVPVFGKTLLDVKVAPLDGTKHGSNPLMCADCIITADPTHTVRANAYDGKLLWTWNSQRSRSKGIVQNLVLQSNGTLLIAGYGGIVARLSLDGTLIWETHVAHAVHSTPTVSNTDIFIACEEWDDGKPGGSLVRLSVNGELKEKHRFSDDFAPARCTFALDLVVVTANDKILRCFRRDYLSQGELWQLQLPGLVRGEIAQRTGVLYMATESGHVLAVDACTGEVIWKNCIAMNFYGSVPYFHENRLIVCDMVLHAHAVNLDTGKREWITRFRSAVKQRPTRMTENRWLFAGCDGDVNLVDVRTGAKLAQSRTDKAILQPGDYRDGKFATLTADGHLQVREIANDLRN